MATVAEGNVERLPSGSLRVRVRGGTDPVTGKERRYTRTVKTEAQAAAELARLLWDAEAERAPDDSAIVGLLLDGYLDVADLQVSTREAREGYIRRTIKPFLGDVRVRKLRADALDALYAHLKRCSRLCGRLPEAEHYTDHEHVCDQRCGPLRDHRTQQVAPVRRPMPSASVQADGARIDPTYPRDNLGGAQPGRPAALSPRNRANPPVAGRCWTWRRRRNSWASAA